MSDPFEIEKALPRLPKIGDGARRAAFNAGKGARAKGFKAKARAAYGNATSKPATKMNGHTKIGAKTDPTREASFSRDDSVAAHALNQIDARPGRRYTAAVYGAAAGVGVGSAGGAIHGRHDYHKSKKQISKARAYRITEVGTAAARMKAKRWPEFPTKSLVGGVAGGAALIYPLQRSDTKNRLKARDRYKQKGSVVKSLEKIPRENKKGKRYGYTSRDAFEDTRYEAKQNYKFTGPHGKENRKIQAHWVGGGAGIGAAAGLGISAASRGALHPAMGAGAGALSGGLYGSAGGSIKRSVRASQRAINNSVKNGKMRPLKSGERPGAYGVIKKSAFGVDHG